MSTSNIRPAFSVWGDFNRALRDVVVSLSEEQLAIQPSPERWPLWATIGHLACQRVSWLCDFAGEPGAETTPFTNALYHCPGDEDLEHPLSALELVEALDSTFRIIDGCLDRWTIGMLAEEIRRPFFTHDWVHTRGWVIQRAFAHDVYHCAEVNETLTRSGLPNVGLWK